MTSYPESGIIVLQSNHSVDQTVEKIEKMLQAKGVKLFAMSGSQWRSEAERAGLHMQRKLLIFGSPKASERHS